MSQCLNPNCLKKNPENIPSCQHCGSKLLLADRYRALQIIGKGGFGRTFLAVDQFKPSKPPCVIKQFLPKAKNTGDLEKAAELFAQEAIRLDDLGKHDRIPELLAYFTQENRQYLVQEFIDGQNLAKELYNNGPLNQTQIRQILDDMLFVLQFVHANNVIHRDIKPENIIRRKSDGKLVLVDFGAAKFADDSNLTGTVIGSAGYIAPEQARGKPTFASDLYSLGITCIHLLTNTVPLELFDVAEGVWVWRNFLKNNFVSEELGFILDKLISQATKKRFQSVDEILAVINNYSPPIISPNLTTQTSTYSPVINHDNSTIFTKSQQVELRNDGLPLTTTIKRKAPAQLKNIEFDIIKIAEAKDTAFWSNKSTLQTHRIPVKGKYITINLNDGLNLDLVPIPGGQFMMGSPENEEERSSDESPQHLVNVQPFFMSKYPITQKQYQMVMNKNPSRFEDIPDSKGRPVEKVSWFDCVQFCQKLSEMLGREFRLPSEAEWEYACRAGTNTPFYFGGTIATDLANYNGSYTYGHGIVGEYRQSTTEVGIFPPNIFGLYDMHGNVWEWCADTWYDNYEGAPDNSIARNGGNDKSAKVLRGGSWLYVPGCCRSAYRLNSLPQNKSDAFGFRVVSSKQ